MPRCNTARFTKTTVVMLAMINAGINIGIISPTLPDIALMTTSTVAEISTTLIWTGIASLLGAVFIGYLFDKMDGMLLLAACLLLEGVGIGLAPMFCSLIAYQALMSITCIFNFGIMTGCLSLNCIIWEDFPTLLGPVVQATDLMQTLGTALTPQIVEPFIGQETSSLPFNSTLTLQNATTTSAGGILPVQVAYIIVAIFDVATAAVCLLTGLFSKQRRRGIAQIFTGEACHTGSDEENQYLLQDRTRNSLPEDLPPREPRWKCTRICERSRLHMTSPSLSSPINEMDVDQFSDNSSQELTSEDAPVSRKTVVLLAILFLFFVVNGGRDAMLTGLLFTYLKDYLNWDDAPGALLVTLYQLTRVVTHGVIVFMSQYVRPKWLTVDNLIVLVISSTIMIGMPYLSKTFGGFSIIIMGVATSNIHPTTITLAEESIHVSSRIMGLFIAAIASGQIIFSPLAGYLLQVCGVMSFPSLLLALSLAGVALFVVWWVVMGSTEKERKLFQDRPPQATPARMMRLQNGPRISMSEA